MQILGAIHDNLSLVVLKELLYWLWILSKVTLPVCKTFFFLGTALMIF